MKKILICLMSLMQVFAISASGERFINSYAPAKGKQTQNSISRFSPEKGGKATGFSPYSPISYIAPSPNDVTQMGTPPKVASGFLKNIVSKKTTSVCIVQQQKSVAVEQVQDRNIDGLIALAFKHEEGIFKRQMTRVSRSFADIEDER